jgi:uncharacterized protein (DUF779 family)
MREVDVRVLRPATAPPGVRAPQIYGSPAAVTALRALCRERGRSVVLLDSACSGVSLAHICPESDFTPTDHQVWIGAVAHCSVHADRACIALCPHTELTLDLHAPRDGNAPPLFMTRPASVAERQQRLFSACARGE